MLWLFISYLGLVNEETHEGGHQHRAGHAALPAHLLLEEREGCGRRLLGHGHRVRLSHARHAVDWRADGADGSDATSFVGSRGLVVWWSGSGLATLGWFGWTDLLLLSLGSRARAVQSPSSDVTHSEKSRRREADLWLSFFFSTPFNPLRAELIEAAK